MLVSQEAVDGEARLVADAEPALAEDVEALRLRRQQHLPQPLVPRLEPRDLVDDDLPLHRHAQAERAAPAARLAGLAASGGSCAAHDRRDGSAASVLPHDAGGEDDAALGIGHL